MRPFDFRYTSPAFQVRPTNVKYRCLKDPVLSHVIIWHMEIRNIQMFAWAVPGPRLCNTFWKYAFLNNRMSNHSLIAGLDILTCKLQIGIHNWYSFRLKLFHHFCFFRHHMYYISFWPALYPIQCFLGPCSIKLSQWQTRSKYFCGVYDYISGSGYDSYAFAVSSFAYIGDINDAKANCRMSSSECALCTRRV